MAGFVLAALNMIALILAIAVFCFLMDQKADWTEDRPARTAMKGLGTVIAFGVLVMAFFSIFETKSANSSWAFRTGELVPVVQEMNEGGHEVLLTYFQKSWWKWKKDGEWETRLNPDGEWEYLDKGKWIPVPLDVYSNTDDDRSMEADNRGWHEQ